MPKRRKVPRESLRLPKAMLNKVREIVDDFPELHYTLLSFVESSVREKIEKFLLISRSRDRKAETQASV